MPAMGTGWWVHDLVQAGETTRLIAWIFWVIFSICLHELAHGWAAIWQGDNTPREMGHMTMNPMVHMGPWSLLVFALIGIAWGLMPVNPARFRSGRMGRVYVAAAGPAMNVGLAIVALTGAAIWAAVATDGRLNLDDDVTIFLFTGGWLNLLLAVFNLLPVPPLDGSRILGGLSLRFYQLFEHPQAQIFGLFFMLAIFMTPIGDVVFISIGFTSRLFVDVLLLILT